MTTEFYDRIPKDPLENIEWRKWVYKRGFEDPEVARELWIMSSRDILFWINTFGWLLEPRRLKGSKAPKVIPFITRDYQDDALLSMKESFGSEDVVLDKSREMGATWMCLYLFEHEWQFEPWTVLGLVSRTEDAVDNRDDPDALMNKLDFIIKHQPAFIRPKFHRTHLRLTNLDNKSVMHGYSATGDVARGGRKRAMLQEEFAAFAAGDDYKALNSTQYVTPSRFFVSTIRGPSGAYYDVCHGDKKKRKKIILDWKDDNEKAAGLYTSELISEVWKLKILDEGYEFPAGYPFVLDGKIRSPYYDAECERPGATPQSIAQELDRDPGASGYPAFDPNKMEISRRTMTKRPTFVGRIAYDKEDYTPTLVRADNGPLKLWLPVDAYDEPPSDLAAVVGADIASGRGGSFVSNSVAFAISKRTGEQIGEFVTRDHTPIEFARICKALCLWLGRALLIWEANGPTGSQFTSEIVRIGYENMYRRNVEQVGHRKKTEKLGWWTDDDNKGDILGAFQEGIFSTKLLVRSNETFEECKQYQYKNGVIVHLGSATTMDEASRGKSHGDRVMAGAMAWHACAEREVKKTEIVQKIPVGSMAERMAEHEAKLAAKEYDEGWY